MDLSDFLILDQDGNQTPYDVHGPYLAFLCYYCDHPVLASSVVDEKGSDDAKPAHCRSCGMGYVLDVRERSKKLYIFEPFPPV